MSESAEDLVSEMPAAILAKESDASAATRTKVRKVFQDFRVVVSSRVWLLRNRTSLDFLSAISIALTLVPDLEAVGAIAKSEWVDLLVRFRTQGMAMSEIPEICKNLETIISRRMAPVIAGYPALDRELVTGSYSDAAMVIAEYCAALSVYELMGNNTLRVCAASSRRGITASDPLVRSPPRVTSFRRRDPVEVLAEAREVVKGQQERIEWARRRIVRDRKAGVVWKLESQTAVVEISTVLETVDALDLAERAKPYQEKNGDLFKA